MTPIKPDHERHFSYPNASPLLGFRGQGPAGGYPGCYESDRRVVETRLLQDSGSQNNRRMMETSNFGSQTKQNQPQVQFMQSQSTTRKKYEQPMELSQSNIPTLLTNQSFSQNNITTSADVAATMPLPPVSCDNLNRKAMNFTNSGQT